MGSDNLPPKRTTKETHTMDDAIIERMHDQGYNTVVKSPDKLFHIINEDKSASIGGIGITLCGQTFNDAERWGLFEDFYFGQFGTGPYEITCKECRKLEIERMKSEILKDIVETYTMIFTCFNCGTEFPREVEKGKEAHGKGGTCPYCNAKDYHSEHGWIVFERRKPGPDELDSDICTCDEIEIIRTHEGHVCAGCGKLRRNRVLSDVSDSGVDG